MRAGSLTEWPLQPQPVPRSLWAFPPSSEWPDEDLIGVGADLEPGTLITAYRQGLYPMPVDARGKVCGWWSPNPRGVLPLDNLRVTRSLRQSARKFEVRIDTCFSDVVRGCATPSRTGTWITREFVEAYIRLHRLGWAHSIETFDRDGRLAGGLYGVRIAGLFAGESMFHVSRDASKVALMSLVQLMRDTGMTLLDVQQRTDHLASLGAIEISRAEYLALLANALRTRQAKA